MARTDTTTASPKIKTAKSYKHPESESPMRPEVGTQSEFKKKLPPKKYRHSRLPLSGMDRMRPVSEAKPASPRLNPNFQRHVRNSTANSKRRTLLLT